MKIAKPETIARVKQAARAGLLLVIVAALTLEATSIIQYIYSQKGIKEEASLRAQSEMEATKLKVINVVDQAETAVRNSMWIASWCLDIPDSMHAVTRRLVKDNPVVIGSCIAMVPGYSKKYPLYAPYTCIEDGKLADKSLAGEQYDYPSQEWFTKPLETKGGYWSEPYFDEGGGNVLMTTYSVPITDRYGKIAAVFTADISLDWLTDLVGSVKVYPSAFSMMFSRSGKIMVGPVDSIVMNKSISEMSSESKDSAVLGPLSRTILAGGTGSMPIELRGKKNYVYYSPVERTGWSMSIVIPDEEIFGNIRKLGLVVKLLQLLGIAMLILILRSVIKSQVEFSQLEESKEKMEHELQIARDIQMSMLPKFFPPFPERHDLDMCADLVSAKEVGGDLYDFYIRDERLFFCIGDVSGKGVPASLVMAVTRSLFRTVSAHEKSPQRIVTAMNESMSDMNENNMFVTFFCGVLDLTTGHLRYCNAGHNGPVILTDHKDFLPVEPNLPLGIIAGMSFKEQETDLHYDDALFLYTDGLTEAENINHELFGEERMLAALSGRRPSQEHLSNMQNAVAGFVGDAGQSDDLTMLFIHYLNDVMPNTSERHLILHNDIQQIPQLAEFVQTIADEKHLDQSQAMGLNLALEEAVTNVIMYAYPEGSDGLVEVEAILKKDALEFILTDSGKPFDPTATPEADTTLGVEDRPVGGLGIYLVRNIMDTVTYRREDGKNILTMIKKI
ncbi:MAG: SpoIIE family protein phosphatase [Bacteroidales bacterium]|nr:SpoIIE family protein phosphatase [Bacteroidales bacterium]